MSRLATLFFALALSLVLVGISFAQTQERPPQTPTAPVAPRALANNEPNYLKLRKIKVGTEIVHVKDFTLKREAGTFTFKSGAFQFVEAVNGKITGAVFVGDATFVLTPPIDLERRNLASLPEASRLKSDSPARCCGLPREARKRSERQGQEIVPPWEEMRTAYLATCSSSSRKNLRKTSRRVCWRTC